MDWIGDNGASGREYVRGTFDAATREVRFTGETVEHGDDVVRCAYRAVLSPDGDRLQHGSWTHRDWTVPGTWQAARLALWGSSETPDVHDSIGSP